MADEVVEMLREAAREALPPVEGELQVGGLSGPVEIRRDRWGVPHISASTLHDLFLIAALVATVALIATVFLREVPLTRTAERPAEDVEQAA